MGIPLTLVNPEAVARIVAGIWDEYARQCLGTLPHWPTEEELKEVVETALAVSVERDEHRALDLVLQFGGEEVVTAAFSSPLPLMVSTLRRLAHALHPANSHFVVGTSGSHLSLLGISGPLRQQSPGLSVRISGAGALVFSVRGSAAVAVRQGRITRGNLRLSDSRAVFNRPIDASAVSRSMYREWIAARMMSLGHGGALLVVPSDSQFEQFLESPPTARFVAGRNIVEQVARMEEVRGKCQDGGLWHEALLHERMLMRDVLDDIAQLTAIDGMTVVRPDLSVWGAGVFFSLKQRKFEIVIHDPFVDDGEASDAELGGARHRSAAYACEVVSGALAIVASSDGGLTAMISDEKVLNVYKHIDLCLQGTLPYP